MPNLLVVESPGKIKKIQSYVGNGYIVAASIGHIRGLPAKQLGIDIDNNYEPTFLIDANKTDVVKKLRGLAKENPGAVYLCSDPDREGEAISFHIKEVLGLNENQIKRASFNKITKPAILSALKNPTQIDMNMVHSQFARSIIDKLIGFKVSPILWKQFINNHLSAGRVQSVVAKLIIERENEISTFKSANYFNLEGKFDLTNTTNNSNRTIKQNELVKASCDSQLTDYSQVEKLFDLNKSGEAKYTIDSVKKSNTKRKPSPPYDTCTLQQEASNKLGMSPDICMKNAQKLYEAGVITYMRTDCLMIAEEALTSIGEYIKGRWGDEYHNKTHYKTKDANAQEAHEAIRVIDPNILDVSNIEGLNSAHNRLYQLIWRRTIACQMSPADVELKTVKIKMSYNSSNNNSINMPSVEQEQPIIKKKVKIVKKKMDNPELSTEKSAIDDANIASNTNISLPSNLLFSAKHENILFKGFLIVYEKSSSKKNNIDTNDDDSNDDNNDDENNDGNDSKNMIDSDQLGKIFDSLSIGANVLCHNIIADERISKPTHPRYTEASLVKQLKQLNIGRPATFASMVAKVQERQYADIRSIEGSPVILRTAEYSYPNKVNCVSNECITGKDNNKLMPTQLGRMINDFLNEKFAEFMDYTFTARVENMLDEIANGKLNWVIVVDTVYKTIKPTIDQLAIELAKVAKDRQTAEKEGDLTPKYSQYDLVLGENPSNGHTIAITQTRFGYAICERHPSNKKLHKYASFTGSPDNMTLKKALALLVYPRELGEYEGVMIQLCRAKSIYIKYGDRNFSIDIFNKSFPDNAIADIPNTTYEQARNVVKLTIDNNIKIAGGVGDINLTSEIVIKPTGRYGPYIKYQGIHNIALGKPILKKYDNDVSKITIDDCNILIGKFMAKKNSGGGNGKSDGKNDDLTAKFKSGSGKKTTETKAKANKTSVKKVTVRKETTNKDDKVNDKVNDKVDEKPKKVVVRKKKE